MKERRSGAASHRRSLPPQEQHPWHIVPVSACGSALDCAAAESDDQARRGSRGLVPCPGDLAVAVCWPERVMTRQRAGQHRRRPSRTGRARRRQAGRRQAGRMDGKLGGRGRGGRMGGFKAAALSAETGIEVSTVCRESWLLLFNVRKLRAGGCDWRGRDGWAGWLIG
jgi:hypothetical protein